MTIKTDENGTGYVNITQFAMFSMNPMHLFATIIPWIIGAAVFHFYGITEKQFQSF